MVFVKNWNLVKRVYQWQQHLHIPGGKHEIIVQCLQRSRQQPLLWNRQQKQRHWWQTSAQGLLLLPTPTKASVQKPPRQTKMVFASYFAKETDSIIVLLRKETTATRSTIDKQWSSAIISIFLILFPTLTTNDYCRFLCFVSFLMTLLRDLDAVV